MTKVIYPKEGRYLRIDTIRDCVMVHGYVERNYETQELRCYTFCGKDVRSWHFKSINAVLTFYAYILNHIGFDDFKLRLKQRLT